MNLKSEIGIEINFSLDFTYRVFVPCSGYQINRTLKDVEPFNIIPYLKEIQISFFLLRCVLH